MYSSLGNVQVIVALLKKYGIDNVVISAGTRHTPLVHSLENDDFFHTYSVVDERSASFFAIGMIEAIGKPVAICCTSGTAACNYLSGITEALYQQLPLLVITADRNPYYLFQQEEQMAPQEHMFKDFCKCEVTLPIVRDEKDLWYCARKCNEALIELTHREIGPVHINFPVENDYPIKQGIVKFECGNLPDIRKIEIVDLESSDDVWRARAEKLKRSKILIIYGQHRPLNSDELELIESFGRKYDCIISKDILANLHVECSLQTFSMMRANGTKILSENCPDIVITMNANTVSEIKSLLMRFKGQFEHWHVSKDGKISDPFKCLPDVIECSPITFFKKFVELGGEDLSSHPYYDAWKNAYQQVTPDGDLNSVPIEYSALYVVQQYIKKLPDSCLFHVANSNSIRLANYFKVKDSIGVYGNRGAHGIDGSMSAFIGQANYIQKLSFLLIGDLSFFYDMNALWNQYIGKNIRIMVCNNDGGAIFYSYPNKKNIPTLDNHIAAKHHNSVQMWAEDRGFIYLAAKTKKEYDEKIAEFMHEQSDKPILLEVFTDKDIDAKEITKLNQYYQPADVSIRNMVAKHMPEGMKETIKKMMK